MFTSGSFNISDSKTEECVSISIISDINTEIEECFNYTISNISTMFGANN